MDLDETCYLVSLHYIKLSRDIWSKVVFSIAIVLFESKFNRKKRVNGRLL